MSDLPNLDGAREALAACGEERRMVHRDHLRNALAAVDILTADNKRLTDQVRSYQGALREVATCGICKGYGETGDRYMETDAYGEAYEVDTREPCASCHGTGFDIQHLDALTARLAEAEATLLNERGEGDGPSEGWAWSRGAWENGHVRVCRVGRAWSASHGGNLGYYPTARAAMKAADAAKVTP